MNKQLNNPIENRGVTKITITPWAYSN